MSTTPSRVPQTLGDLLREAIDQSNLEVNTHDPKWKEAIQRSTTVDDMVKVVEDCADGFEKFRGRGECIRRALKPIAAFVLFFADAGSDAAAVSSRP